MKIQKCLFSIRQNQLLNGETDAKVKPNCRFIVRDEGYIFTACKIAWLK